MAKILVVDDDLGLREAVYYAFTQHGHQVTTAIDSANAMELIIPGSFDLIILDIVMPGESGTDLLKRLRKQGNRVPVVIYSVRVDAMLEIEMHQLGASEVMHKSVSLEVLVDRTEKVLRSLGTPQITSTEVTRTLLVIDPSRLVRQVVETFFQRKGYHVIQAASGAEGLEKARAREPGIVLLDTHLEGMSSLETLRKLLGEFPKMGVVMATADENDDIMSEAMKMGAYGYVLKPFDFLYLELVVASRLNIAQTPDGPRL